MFADVLADWPSCLFCFFFLPFAGLVLFLLLVACETGIKEEDKPNELSTADGNRNVQAEDINQNQETNDDPGGFF